GASFDGSHSVFAGAQEIGGFNPYTREFLGPGIVQDQPAAGVNPVRVLSVTRFYGLFASDVLSLASNLDLTLGGRFNDAQIALEDELGGPVNGRHTFNRFNPSVGLSYRFAHVLQFYGNFSQTNRAPTPQELSCASAATPCSLLNFFVGDPNLRQVVAHTFEAGVRGQTGDSGGRLTWNLDAYHTLSSDDIIYEATVYNPNLAFYTNAGRTLRRGVEANLRYEGRRVHVTLGYALTDATFQTPLLLNSGSNPAADPNGQEQVLPGDRVPGVPRHRANLVVDYSVTERFSVGGSAVLQSNAYRFGDEANLTRPVGGYTVIDLNAAFRPTDHLTLFAVVNNALDRRYDTYGSFGPVGDVPWPNVPGGVSDARTASPGAPLSVYGGARLTF
ncbi:MAG: putative TonB-dependent receptor, partial [Gammaproteobacteria bacterium]|nr:putative TonB-dependent receptor [Gammaproteobacteria bacterium]